MISTLKGSLLFFLPLYNLWYLSSFAIFSVAFRRSVFLKLLLIYCQLFSTRYFLCWATFFFLMRILLSRQLSFLFSSRIRFICLTWPSILTFVSWIIIFISFTSPKSFKLLSQVRWQSHIGVAYSYNSSVGNVFWQVSGDDVELAVDDDINYTGPVWLQ